MLDVPPSWDVHVFRPRTPAPLSQAELAAALEAPAGQPALREQARGKSRPVIILDDLTRPTPADRVLPLVLRQLEEGGIRREQVTLLIGGGTHRAATPEQALRKVGRDGHGCRIVVHDQRRDLVRMGRTSFGSPVIVNREVAGSDLLIGIGGVYPQHSVGFGGGSKLLLGVLGRRSIVYLHYGHGSVAGTYDIDNDFRRDLDEMAEIVAFRFLIALHVDADREIVRIAAGDFRRFYRQAVAFSRSAYSAPAPDHADVVIANAYPMDVSLTFTRSKGMAPLYRARPGASRVLIAACTEGLGQHGLFPYLNGPRWEKQIHRLRRISVIRPSAVPGKIMRRLRRAPEGKSERLAAGPVTPPRRPIVFLRTDIDAASLPATLPGMSVEASWAGVLEAVERDQAGKDRLVVAVYPCSPLHCLDLTGSEVHDHLAGAAVP